jgi:hypothetical protein
LRSPIEKAGKRALDQSGKYSVNKKIATQEPRIELRRICAERTGRLNARPMTGFRERSHSATRGPVVCSLMYGNDDRQCIMTRMMHFRD